MLHVAEVRQRCRIEARRFGFSETLFNRIPIYFFRYFMSTDPLLSNPQGFTQYNIMTVFMVINRIDAGLLMAFYNAAEQNIDTLFEIHAIYSTLWRLYERTNADDLLDIFGNFYAYHLETRTLRRIDMSIVNYHQTNHEQFVPDTVSWQI